MEDIRAGAELQHMAGMALEALTTRVHDDQFAAALGELFEIGGGDGVVLRRVGTDHDGHVSVFNLVESSCHSTGADIFQKSCNRGRMAKPRAVIDIVVAEALPDQLLKQVSFFIRAFGRTKPCNLTTSPFHALCRNIKRFFPSRFPEMGR